MHWLAVSHLSAMQPVHLMNPAHIHVLRDQVIAVRLLPGLAGVQDTLGM